MEWALRRHVLHRSRTNQMASPLVYHSLPQLYANHKPMLTLHQETAFRNEPSLFGGVNGAKGAQSSCLCFEAKLFNHCNEFCLRQMTFLMSDRDRGNTMCFTSKVCRGKDRVWNNCICKTLYPYARVYGFLISLSYMLHIFLLLCTLNYMGLKKMLMHLLRPHHV